MRKNKPQVSSLYIVTVAGSEFAYFNGFRFTSFSGIIDETKTYPYISPFLHREYSIPSHRFYQPVTLTLPYIASDHNKLFKSWNSYKNQPLQIKIEPIRFSMKDEELSLGYEIVLNGATWTQCTAGSVDRLDSKVSDISLQFIYVSAEEIQI